MDCIGWAILAQTPGDAAAVPESVQVQSVWDFVRKGGLMMIPIGLCSLLAVAVITERLISLRRKVVIPPAFLTGLTKVLKDGDRPAAVAYCRKNDSPVANVLGAVLRKIDRSPEAIERHVQESAQREVLKLRKNLRSLAVIASVTPLMGLLGTIFGMIRAFQTVAVSGEALGKTEMLAGGIYEAMITTAAGLTVAIPVLIFFHVISGRIDKLIAEIDYLTVELIDQLLEGRLGTVETQAASADDGVTPTVKVATT